MKKRTVGPKSSPEPQEQVAAEKFRLSTCASYSRENPILERWQRDADPVVAWTS